MQRLLLAMLVAAAAAFAPPASLLAARPNALRGGSAPSMIEIVSGVEFDTIAREWRMKWTADNDKKSLAEAQKVLNEVLPEIKKTPGVKGVQRVVCGGCLDFKVITSLSADDFNAWEEKGFAPEAAFLKKAVRPPRAREIWLRSSALYLLRRSRISTASASSRHRRSRSCRSEASATAYSSVQCSVAAAQSRSGLAGDRPRARSVTRAWREHGKLCTRAHHATRTSACPHDERGPTARIPRRSLPPRLQLHGRIVRFRRIRAHNGRASRRHELADT